MVDIRLCRSTTPYFLIAVVPLIALFCLLQYLYIPASRQLQGLESVSKSPIYSHLGETLNGVSSIRAYGEEERFIQTNDDVLNAHNKPLYLLNVSKCWIETRLETLGNLITFFSALFVVFSRDELTMGAAGLSLCYSIGIVVALKELLNKICELENNSVALERILEYCNLEQEAPWEQGTDLWDKPWPNQGWVTFKELQDKIQGWTWPCFDWSQFRNRWFWENRHLWSNWLVFLCVFLFTSSVPKKSRAPLVYAKNN